MNVTAATASRNYTSQQYCLDVADIGEGPGKQVGRELFFWFSVSTEMAAFNSYLIGVARCCARLAQVVHDCFLSRNM